LLTAASRRTPRNQSPYRTDRPPGTWASACRCRRSPQSDRNRRRRCTLRPALRARSSPLSTSTRQSCKTDDIALELVARGASVDDGCSACPVVVAVEQGHARALTVMLARPPSPSSLAAGLCVAASRGSSELGTQILDAGAEPATDAGTSPLASAGWSGNVALVRTLVGRGADREVAALAARCRCKA
jgi:hypothetical protein